MTKASVLLGASLAWSMTLFACASSGDPATDEWRVTRVVNGTVTTIRNEAGSKWGRPARLVEELSIGEEASEAPFIFGDVTDIWATEDRIYVVDIQVPAVRVYDHNGNYIKDIGAAGPGPGEYEKPHYVAVASDGRIFVTELSTVATINVYGEDGNYLETWTWPRGGTGIGFSLSVDDVVYVGLRDYFDLMAWPTTIGRSPGSVHALGPGGPIGEPLAPPDLSSEPTTFPLTRRGTSFDIPLGAPAPEFVWALAPSGAIVAGVSNAYRFEFHAPDGAINVVEKYWDPIQISDSEVRFNVARIVDAFRLTIPGFPWNGKEFPRAKSAYSSFMVGREGRIWVRRPGRGTRRQDCDNDLQQLNERGL